VGSDRVPLDDIQRYLRDQLQQLRTEVLRYEEAIGEQHKLENANKLLNQQIKAEKERGVKLEQDVLGYRQSEDGLKSQYAQLERELADFREAAHEQHARLEREFDDFREAANQQDSDPSELEQELINMRHQMRKTEEIARNKTTELNHANYRIQERGNEVARVRVISTSLLKIVN
jgi:chromosome segregation ATPase